MSDLRRQKRKAVREAKKNQTGTKIDDELAVMLDRYLTDPEYFIKQKELCKELELDYPKDAKSGYELPLFNKNPITNEIEIHTESTSLLTTFQIRETLITTLIGRDTDDPEVTFVSAFIKVMDEDPEFTEYLIALVDTATEKGKSVEQALMDNIDDIGNKLRAHLL